MEPRDLANQEIRNLVRGAIGNKRKHARNTTIDRARRLLTIKDAPALATIMCVKDLDKDYFGPLFPKNLSSIYSVTKRQEIGTNIECTFQVTRLVHYLPQLVQPLELIRDINQLILTGHLQQACLKCTSFIDAYGVSAALARKIVYLHSRSKTLPASQQEEYLNTYASPLLRPLLAPPTTTALSQLVHLTLDACDVDVSCLDVMQEHLGILRRILRQGEVLSPYKKMMQRIIYPVHGHSILNSTNLLFFTSSTAIDLFTDFSTLWPLEAELPPELKVLWESEQFQSALTSVQPNRSTLAGFLRLEHPDEPEEAVYRLAAAMPEVSVLANWRRAIDCELSHRLLPEAPREESSYRFFPLNLRLPALCKAPQGRMKTYKKYQNSNADAFLRSIAVLSRLRQGEKLATLQSGQIRHLLAQTTGFSKLLDESELLELRDHSEKEDSHVIVFLTMVMLNEKKPTEDLAFEMRLAFQEIVFESFQGDILRFLDWFNERTPSLSRAVVKLCDITFLERLYLLIPSYSDVLETRIRLCRWAARVFERPEYVVIAERLVLDAQVSRIRGKIDDSRIYVDDVRYKQWTMDVVGPLLRKFERVVAVSMPKGEVEVSSNTGRSQDKEAPASRGSYWFTIACKVAYEEFCHNRIYGIDSYLSRRIRHGTLAGTLIVPVREKVEQLRAKEGISLSRNEVLELSEVLKKYEEVVVALRDDLLHFRSDAKPKGLLNSDFIGTAARRRLHEDFHGRVVNLLLAGYTAPTLCPYFLDHCWDLLVEDLYRVQEEVRSLFNGVVRPLVRSLGMSKEKSPIWRHFVSDLDQTTEGLFRNLLGWFSKSEGSYMSVSMRELVTVVVEEVGGYWPDYGKNFTFGVGGGEVLSGLLYHTVYDLLTVVFGNIAKHADLEWKATIDSILSEGDCDAGGRLTVRVVSRNRSDSTERTVAGAIALALEADRENEAMVREGRSGLGKARAIITAYSEKGEFSCKAEGDHCVVTFGIPVVMVGLGEEGEKVIEEHGTEGGSDESRRETAQLVE